MKFKLYPRHTLHQKSFYLRIGNCNGGKFEIVLEHFRHEGFRLIVNLNTDKLIKLFGFNQRVYGV